MLVSISPEAKKQRNKQTQHIVGFLSGKKMVFSGKICGVRARLEFLFFQNLKQEKCVFSQCPELLIPGPSFM